MRLRPTDDRKLRHGTVYYRCHPANNNRGRPDKYAGHPATIYLREDLILTEVNRFFAERIFGPQRRELFRADLAQVEDTARREHQAQLQRLRRTLADTVRKQDNVLRQAEDADPRDPFTLGLRQRYHELESERHTLLARIAESDRQQAPEPQRPSADEATLSLTLPADDLIDIAEIGHTVAEQLPPQPAHCDEPTAQSPCASCTCPRWGSNPHCGPFKGLASAGWATGARTRRARMGSVAVLAASEIPATV